MPRPKVKPFSGGILPIKKLPQGLPMAVWGEPIMCLDRIAEVLTSRRFGICGRLPFCAVRSPALTEPRSTTYEQRTAVLDFLIFHFLIFDFRFPSLVSI